MGVVKRLFELLNYVLPVSRTQVAADIYSTHHDLDLLPHPQLFQLERFLEKFLAYDSIKLVQNTAGVAPEKVFI